MELALREQPDGKLQFGLSSWYRGFLFGLYGVATPLGENRWLYRDGMNSADPGEHCILEITIRWDGTPYAKVDDESWCKNAHGAGNDIVWIGFRPSEYWSPVTHELDDTDGFFQGSGECDGPKPQPSAATR